MSKLNLVLTVIILPIMLLGITIEVPGDYSTIQAAVYAISSENDYIYVSPGTYTEDIWVPDKFLNLIGLDTKTTIIEGKINMISYSEPQECFLIENLTIYGNSSYSINCDGQSGTLRNLIIDGQGSNGVISGLKFKDVNEILIENCTIFYNHYGIYIDGDSCNIDIQNSIFNNWNFDLYGGASQATIDVSYSCTTYGIEGFDNVGNMTINYTENMYGETGLCEYNDEIDLEYYLLESSPCIDAGNPGSSYNDPDGTRSDMGALATTFDIKRCEGDHWNWESFPRVGTSVNDIYDTVTHILDMDDLYPIYAYDPGMLVDYDGYVYYSAYNGSYWTPNYNLYSACGYKVYRDDEEDFYVPLEGYRLSNTYQFSFTADDEKWLGYWIPETRNIVDAFNDLWSHVKTIEAEDWYYQRETGGFGTPSSSTTGKNLEYGKMYIITMDISTTYNWDSPGGGGIEKSSEKAETEYFTYEDQPDYLAIDVLDISDSIEEIGVFQGTTCIGASVIDSSSVQILAYIDPDLRDLDELTIQYITQRGTQNDSKLCWVYNEESGEFKKERIQPAGQKYILLSLQESYPDMENPIPGCHLYLNYPNPFNPETNIKFYLSSEATECALSIFNIRGQKVRYYDLNSYTGGCEHTVVWDGYDDQGKKVSSGVYFYQLNSDQGSLSHKMLMMK